VKPGQQQDSCRNPGRSPSTAWPWQWAALRYIEHINSLEIALLIRWVTGVSFGTESGPGHAVQLRHAAQLQMCCIALPATPCSRRALCMAANCPNLKRVSTSSLQVCCGAGAALAARSVAQQKSAQPQPAHAWLSHTCTSDTKDIIMFSTAGRHLQNDCNALNVCPRQSPIAVTAALRLADLADLADHIKLGAANAWSSSLLNMLQQ
jgi:hypothetical protein